MRNLFILVVVLVCLVVGVRAEEELNFRISDENVIKIPNYKCPVHGTTDVTVGVNIDGEVKYLCAKCYAEFLYNNITELEEIK